MTCKELNLWLLATDLLASPPREVRSHLDVCSHCHQQHHRLLRLNEKVHDLPVPPPSPDARANLLRGLDAARGPRPVFWPHYRWYALAGAAALLLAVLGIAVVNGLHRQPGDPSAVVEPAHNPQAAAQPSDAVGNVLDRHLKLARGLTPAERFQELSGIAGDLHAESLRLAKSPASAELAEVVKLYRDVVNRGRLAKRADELPMADKKRLILPLLPELHQNEKAAEQLAAAAPADTARSLRELTATTRELRGELSKLVGVKPL
jgi:hypothetical protein